ncbi:23S rRNA (adenine(2503)-C(2))-methyltransferase RlmN [Candidatus Peregrinibacteria bacterium]|nr:23S rRNA (adenine(2503)-C(2))-methyltransferase RlmN [Candidatus Peregrinibacteria bacterium]
MISKQAITAYCKEKGIPSFRAKQILHAFYKEGRRNFTEISVLPRDLQKSFGGVFPIFSFEVAREVVSQTGDTIKTLFKLHDGKLIEGVLMRFRDNRNSVCVSSQVGCGLKCAFCATGTMGFIRNLTAEEIADQVLYFDHWLKKNEKNKLRDRVNHVIFMGMGEPFLNYEEVMKSVKILNDPDLLGIAARHITVSTSGVIPGIEKLAQEKTQINLAISIHAPNQTLREKFMPIAKAYKLDALIKAIKAYIQKTHRRVSYEYVMLKNINDSENLARELAKLIKGQQCHVNLIPYNETYLGFSNAGKSRIDGFREILESFDIPVTVRVSLGQDISAACGQLAINPKP